ncbi:MAG: CoA transferase subunit A, partial [Gemmataceae bacterium]
LSMRLRSADMGVPFLPARNMMGTDTFENSAGRIIECPFTSEKLVALPALSPDVSAIHVHEADCYGNCRIRGTTVADLELARASKRLIITCERLIPNEEIRRDPTQTVIPFFCVDAVCEVPFGSYPGNMPYEYFSDEDHLKLWLTTEQEPEEFARFLDEYIYNVEDFNAYLHLCGGIPRLLRLRRRELFLTEEGL